MKKLLYFIFALLTVACGLKTQTEDSDNNDECNDNICWEDDSIYPSGGNNLANYFFPDTFIIRNNDILYFANRLTTSHPNTVDSLMKWKDDVVNLSEQNRFICEIGLDSAINIVEEQIFPNELKYGRECTLARVDIAYREANIWLFRVLYNYSMISAVVKSDILKSLIDKEFSDWWSFMKILNSEIEVRIRHYGGSDIGATIGNRLSFILECRAMQLKADLQAIISRNQSSLEPSKERMPFLDIDSYLFNSIEMQRSKTETTLADPSTISFFLEYLNQTNMLRSSLMKWIESRLKIATIISDKRTYQENTLSFLYALPELDLEHEMKFQIDASF